MKIVLVDSGGVGSALALRAAEWGHEVFHYIEDKPENNQATGTGLHKNIKRTKQWLNHAAEADLVVSTENGNFLNKLEGLRKRGIKVFAPSQKVADLEIERGKGLKFLEEHGIEVPEYKTFTSFDQAEAYIRENPQPYVFKTLGDQENKALTFVGKSPEQLIEKMNEWREAGLNVGQIMLQKFIKGIEYGCCRWVGKTGFIGPIETSFEHKKLMSGEKGPNTGEMGTIAKYVDKEKLFDKVLAPLEESLVEMGAFTSVDVNCIIDEDGKPWPLEFTCRFGWPIFNMVLHAHQGDPIEWMIDACNGADTLETSMDVMIGVVLVSPPFPFKNDGEMPHKTDGIPIYGMTDELKKHVQPQGIRMGEFVDGDELKKVKGWVTSDNYIAVICQEAPTIKEAREKAYAIIDKLSISDSYYRDDIGEKVLKVLPELKKFGYCEDWPNE